MTMCKKMVLQRNERLVKDVEFGPYLSRNFQNWIRYLKFIFKNSLHFNPYLYAALFNSLAQPLSITHDRHSDKLDKDLKPQGLR